MNQGLHKSTKMKFWIREINYNLQNFHIETGYFKL